MARTPDEILCFLIRNAKADPFLPVDGTEPDGDNEEWKKSNKPQRLRDLLLRLSGTTRYATPLAAFEAFLEESYSFERHLRPLHEEGALRFQIAEPGSFYDTPKYREIFDKSNGLVKDYDTPGLPSYVVFHVGGDNPFLSMYQEIIQNAVELGLLRKGTTL